MERNHQSPYQQMVRRCKSDHNATKLFWHSSKQLIMDDLLFDTVSDEAIQMLMEDALNGNISEEQNKSIDDFLKSSNDF